MNIWRKVSTCIENSISTNTSFCGIISYNTIAEENVFMDQQKKKLEKFKKRYVMVCSYEISRYGRKGKIFKNTSYIFSILKRIDIVVRQESF